MLSKLQRKKRRLNAPRTIELAGWMENMLDSIQKLTAEYIPKWRLDKAKKLIQKSEAEADKLD